MRKGGFRTFDYSEMESLRGGERTFLYLAEALAKRGHEVVVASLPRPGLVERGNVTLTDVKTALARDYDVAISNNIASAFNGVKTAIKVIWTHNPGFSWGHIRDDFLWKLRHVPYIVHLSRYTRDRSWFLPRAGETTILHGLPSSLLAARRERNSAPPRVAIFASYAVRNLASVIQAWRDVVHPAVPDARLLVTSEVEAKHLGGLTFSELPALNIEIPGTLPWSELMDLFRRSRVLAVPGHFQETFNLLSVEAAACGVPTVTMGVGSLGERVLHDKTGWIAQTQAEMGLALARLLSDDNLWLRYHRACLEHPDLVDWDDRAAAWNEFLKSIRNR